MYVHTVSGIVYCRIYSRLGEISNYHGEYLYTACKLELVFNGSRIEKPNTV